jgi:predicted ATP-grasp superfamily ATP-dependent carboligase
VRIAVLGVSARAMVESAVRGGHEVVAVDFFGDRDLVSQAESYALGPHFDLPLTAAGLGEAAERLCAEAVVYGSNLENHPEVVRQIAGRSVLLGNTPESLEQIRDWRTLRKFCEEAGIRYPVTLLAGEEAHAAAGGRWLRKRVRSGGGHGVRHWDGKRLDTAHYLQSEVEGRAASVAFVANGRQSLVLGLTEQLVGREALGASGFAWCGNVLPLEAPTADRRRLLEQVTHMAAALTSRFGLSGVNGLDLIVGRDVDGAAGAHLVEVNPRYTGSMELLEHMDGIDVFSLHLDGLAGRLPAASPAVRTPLETFAKGIVYARTTCVVPDTDAWLARGISDVPFAGQPIESGRPVCTVRARGKDRQECLNELRAGAAAVYTELEAGREERRERTVHLDHRTHA